MDAILLDLRRVRPATALSSDVLLAIKAILAAVLPEACDYVVVLGLDTDRHSLSNLELPEAQALAAEFAGRVFDGEVERVQ